MTLQQLKDQFAAEGIPLHLDDEVESFIARGTIRAIERGRITSRTCRRCGRPLTDPSSMAAGIGPECAASAAAEAELERDYPVGTMVRFIAGPEQGKAGRVQGIRHGTGRPLRVWIAAGWYAVRASADQVERLEPLTDAERSEQWRLRIQHDAPKGDDWDRLCELRDRETGGRTLDELVSDGVSLEPEDFFREGGAG